jgi:hypothetical protein
MNFTFIFLIITIFTKKLKSNEETTPKQKIQNILKLFKIPIDNDENDYYCPRKHTTSFDKNLCFYISITKRSRISARENCFKKSQRLVEIDSNLTWNALIYSLSKNETEIPDTPFVKSFHIGVLKLTKNNYYIWNNSESVINKNFLCNKSDLIPRSAYKCANLRLTSLNNICYKITECNDSRSIGFSICEWRGHLIEDFNIELYKELIKSYYVILCVFIIYIILIYLLYLIQNYRSIQREALFILKKRDDDNYGVNISNLDVTNLKFMN